MEKNLKDYDFLNEFYNGILAEEKELYKTLANKAIELGYNPKRVKTRALSISFSNLKTKKTLLKFYHDWKNKNGEDKYFWSLKFYANKKYSKTFDTHIKEIIEKFNYKYVGCYGCGKCKNVKLGYIIKYEDGRNYFRCGYELIPIKINSKDIVDEAIKMMEVQHEEFIKELN
jgi:hypothetical protein